MTAVAIDYVEQTRALLADVLAAQEPPHLSLYQPTHRADPERRRDAARFLDLVRMLERGLLREHPPALARTLLVPFDALATNEAFWGDTLDGLVVFGGLSMFRTLRLPQPVPERAIVAERYYVRPLHRFLRSVDPGGGVMTISGGTAPAHAGARP